MDWFIWLAELAVAFHIARTAQRFVRITTTHDSELVWWLSFFAAWGVFDRIAATFVSNLAELAIAGVGITLALLALNRFFDWVHPEPKRESDENRSEVVRYDFDEDYAYEDDEDYEQAVEDAEALRELYEGFEWADIASRVNELIDLELSRLLELRNDLGGDINVLNDRLERAEGKPGNEARVEGLRANIANVTAFYSRVSEGIAGVHNALDGLKVLARERQVDGAPDTKDRTAKMLTEVQRTNAGILSARREVERILA